MEGWHYVAIATAATVLPALGLTLLVRTEVDKNHERRQPRWVRARAAALVAIGGAMAVAAVPRAKNISSADPAPSPELER